MSSKFLTGVCAFTLALATASWPARVWANEFARVTDIKQYGTNVRRREYVRIPDAHVAFANYERIRADWPSTRDKSDAEIDQLILDRYANLSELQLELRGIRTNAFAYDDTIRRTFTLPPGWNRAAVEGDTELADVKGSGQGNEILTRKQVREFREIELINDDHERESKLNVLRTLHHSDGLMTLGEALAETTRQMAVQRLFDRLNAHEGTSFQTVETYFVISLPVDILKENGRTEPAALYGRQANIGRTQGLEVPAHTYIDQHGGMQKTSFESAVDFGGVQIDSKDYVKSFGLSGVDPQKSNAWSYAHDTATAYREHLKAGRENEARKAVETHIAEMLEPVPPTPPRPTAEFDYYRDRLKSDQGGAYSARYLLRYHPHELLETASSFTNSRGLVNLLRASVAMNVAPEEIKAFIPHVIDSISQDVPKTSMTLLHEVLTLPQPYLSIAIREAIKEFPRALFLDTFRLSNLVRTPADAVYEELQIIAAAGGKDGSLATAALQPWAAQTRTTLEFTCKDLFARKSKKKH